MNYREYAAGVNHKSPELNEMLAKVADAEKAWHKSWDKEEMFGAQWDKFKAIRDEYEAMCEEADEDYLI